jgi:hypothetical protein
LSVKICSSNCLELILYLLVGVEEKNGVGFCLSVRIFT